MPSKLKQAISQKEFIVTCELAPPKGSDVSEFLDHAGVLKSLVHAINITDGQGGNMRMSPVIASYLLERETGIESICQIVCRDKNRIGLQSDLLGAVALKLRNFLCLYGDKAEAGDHPNAKDVFDLTTDDLLKAFLNFSQGLDFAENKLNESVEDLCIGAAAHPGVDDLASQSEKMQKRVENGVQFFQTQIVYESDQLKRFLDSIRGKVHAPVLIGITPLKSVKMANYMNEKVYGVTVPKPLIERLEKSNEPQKEGMKIALELVQQVKELGGDGIHLMAIGQEKELPTLLSQISMSQKAG